MLFSEEPILDLQPQQEPTTYPISNTNPIPSENAPPTRPILAQALRPSLSRSGALESARHTIMADTMPLIDQVQKDMVAAMKSREEARLSALRMIKAALMKQKVDSPKPLDEAAEMVVLKMLIKQRIDAADAFRKAGRAEQADKEEAERRLIETYLPAGATEAELDAAVAEALAETGATALKQMGLVMKAAQAKLSGKTVDGKALSDKVRSKLQ